MSARMAWPTGWDSRATALAAFGLLGAAVGVRVLQLFYADIPRRELEDLSRRYKALHARKRRLRLFALRWKVPGAVWAVDHSKPPGPVDGVYPALLAVRDLASGEQLLWQGVEDESAREVELALATLLAEHGAPLVLKKDNGGALNEARLEALLASHGVIALLSPPRTPSYNGSCEAGIGALKRRTAHQAALQGRPARWSSDDCESARLQANATASSPLSPELPPQAVWAARPAISGEFRMRFHRVVDMYREEERKKLAEPWEPHDPLPAVEERRAVRRALQACGLLHIERRGFTLPISFQK
jgi:hypothetical protein